MARTHVVRCLIVSLAAGALCAGTALAAGQQDESQETIEVAPVRIVVLVDESGSLAPAAVAEERRAAALIGLSELSTRSQVAVIGFGSSNGPGQSAVDEVCPLTELSDARARQSIADCVQSIEPRKSGKGDDTDHAAAIRAALDTFRQADPLKRVPVAFMLTDGVLDVHNSAAYGADPASRNREAQQQLDHEILPDAKRAGVQIWPLGFGSAQLDRLEAFAVGGAGSNPQCGGLASAVPHAVVARNFNDVASQLFRAFANARCAQWSGSTGTNLGPGQSAELSVTVPAIATDGSIVVTKIDPRIRVGYVDPDGRNVPGSGTVEGSELQVSGQNSPIEVLRVRNPKPGRWRIRLESVPGVDATNVGASVLWQGAVRAAVVVSPVFPRPGDQVAVQVRLQTRSGVVTDPAALRGLAFAAAIAGDGFSQFPVALRDDGRAPDATARDGTFSGGFALPQSATGGLKVLGSIIGQGVAGDERPWFGKVNLGAQLNIQISMDDRKVGPGGSVGGTVTADNKGDAREARLVLTDLSQGTLATVTPDRFRLATGRSETAFKIHFDSATRLGYAGGKVQVVAADDPKEILADIFLDVDVREPRDLRPLLLGLGALIVLAAVAVAVARARLRARAKRVQGLAVRLFQEGNDLGPETRAPDRGEKAFAVRIESGTEVFFLAPCRPGPDAVVIRRVAPARVGVTLPGQGEQAVNLDQRVAVRDGFSIAVHDWRRDGAKRRRPQARGTPERGGPAPVPPRGGDREPSPEEKIL